MGAYAVLGKATALTGGGEAPTVRCLRCGEQFGLLIDGMWHPQNTYHLLEGRWKLRGSYRKARRGGPYRPYARRLRAALEAPDGFRGRFPDVAYVAARKAGNAARYPERRKQAERQVAAAGVSTPATVECGQCGWHQTVDPGTIA